MRMPPTRPFIAAVLLLGVVGTSPAHAQQPAASASYDLDAIRRELAERPAESTFFGPLRADYRVRIEREQDPFDPQFGWLFDKTNVTPGYIRPWYPINHWDMLALTMPIEHRAQLYPAGIPASAIFGGLKDSARKRKEREAREQVQAELEAIKKQQQ